MKLVEINKKFANDEKYFAFEEASDLKHELINGNLYETSDVSKFHNRMSRMLTILLTNLIKTNDWEIYFEGLK